MVSGAFVWAKVLELVCPTYISLSVCVTVCDAVPVSTAALAVLGVSVALVVMWQSAVWLLFGLGI